MACYFRKLQVFKNKLFGKIFGLKEDKADNLRCYNVRHAEIYADLQLLLWQ
jgi:hypothetical protein